MPQDATFPFDYAEGGVLSNVDGDDFYYNHALQLALMAAGDISGTSLSSADIRGAETKIEETIASSPFFERPVTVRVLESERDEFRAEVDVANVTLPPLPLET